VGAALIERWLKAPVQMEDGKVVRARRGRRKEGHQPTAGDLFLHYAFDMWMTRTYPTIRSNARGRRHLSLQEWPRRHRRYGRACDRFAVCKLVLHPEKTKIVYCKDANRRTISFEPIV